MLSTPTGCTVSGSVSRPPSGTSVMVRSPAPMARARIMACSNTTYEPFTSGIAFRAARWMSVALSPRTMCSSTLSAVNVTVKVASGVGAPAARDTISKRATLPSGRSTAL